MIFNVDHVDVFLMPWREKKQVHQQRFDAESPGEGGRTCESDGRPGRMGWGHQGWKVPRFFRSKSRMSNLFPRNLTWNLKMMVSKRNHLFQGLLFRFHVTFQGCNSRIIPDVFAISMDGFTVFFYEKRITKYWWVWTIQLPKGCCA